MLSLKSRPPTFPPRHFSSLTHKAEVLRKHRLPSTALPPSKWRLRGRLLLSLKTPPNFIPKHFSSLPHKAGGAPKAPPARYRTRHLPRQVAPSWPPLAFSQESTPNFSPQALQQPTAQGRRCKCTGCSEGTACHRSCFPQQVAPSGPPHAFSQESTPNFIPKHFSSLTHKAEVL